MSAATYDLAAALDAARAVASCAMDALPSYAHAPEMAPAINRLGCLITGLEIVSARDIWHGLSQHFPPCQMISSPIKSSSAKPSSTPPRCRTEVRPTKAPPHSPRPAGFFLPVAEALRPRRPFARAGLWRHVPAPGVTPWPSP